jgi:hypothetical protein
MNQIIPKILFTKNKVNFYGLLFNNNRDLPNIIKLERERESEVDLYN